MRPKVCHNWTNHDRAYLRAKYNGTRASINSLATHFGVSVGSVKAQLSYMGLLLGPRPRPWEPGALRKLEAMAGQYSVPVIARAVGRSPNAIVRMCKLQGLKLSARSAWYTESDVCQILGCDYNWVQHYIENGALPAYPHNGLTPAFKAGRRPWHIDHKALVKFIRANVYDISFLRHIDIMALIMLLTDPGPEEIKINGETATTFAAKVV